MRIAIILLGSALVASAADVRLAWDASPTTNAITYRLYGHTNTLSGATLASAVTKQNVGTNLTVTLLNILPARWQFGVTAVDTANGLESDLSNIVLFDVQVPPPPQNLRTVIVQYTPNLIVTNFSNVGFFRLNIDPPIAPAIP